MLAKLGGIASVLFFMSTVGFCQDALRTAVQGDRAYQTRSAPVVRQVDQLRAGPVLFNAGLSYDLEWTDNVRNRATDREWDLIHRPQFSLNGIWPATKDSRLSFGASFGYTKYMREDDLDRFFVSPDSELAWDIPIQNVVITLFDRFEYSQDVLGQGSLSGVAQFPRFDNQAGFRVTWQPAPYVVQGGYTHGNSFSDSDQFDYINHSSEQFFARGGYQFAERAQAGVEVSSALVDYENPIQSDNSNVSLGPYLDWQVTEYIHASVRGGYVFYSFDPSLATPEGSDLSSYYFGVEARHQLTDNISHGISANREIQQSLNRGGQYNQRLRFGYNATWAFHRRWTASGNVFYEQGTEPRIDFEEDYDQYGAGLGLGFRITSRLTSRLGYTFANRESNQGGRNYVVNRVTLGASYTF